jgi:phosphatidylglycerol:prolipoprotein diacylglycerol transferase
MNLLAISPYVFGTNLTWYSVFVLLGAIVTYIVTEYFYRKNEESKKCPDLILNTFLIAFPSGLAGARIWYILSELEYYLSDPISMLKVWEGGLAIQGGVLLGALVGIWYVTHMIRKYGLNLKVTTIMDMAIPNILIAQVIGRWGNFFNREVYGACVDGESLWFLPKFIKDI